MNDQEKRIAAMDAMLFLREHVAISPEINGDSIFDGLWFMMAKCCKRGKSEFCGDDGISVYAFEDDMEEAEKFADQFVKEHGEDWRTQELSPEIRVPYEEYYGEPWVFDHVEYWYETTFFVFEGNPYERFADMDYKKWGRYAGPQGGANTWEDMIIDCAAEIKKVFGDFSDYHSFYTKAEIKNHKDETPVFFVPADRKGCKLMEWNDRHVHVDIGLRNLRWTQWFMETDYAKKNWEYHFKDWALLVAKIDELEPKERKEILHADTDT